MLLLQPFMHNVVRLHLVAPVFGNRQIFLYRTIRRAESENTHFLAAGENRIFVLSYQCLQSLYRLPVSTIVCPEHPLPWNKSEQHRIILDFLHTLSGT